MPQKLLLISHTFPPATGIGGRRWAKFAKYLVRNGWEVFVLTSPQRKEEESSFWTKDVDHPMIHRWEINDHYPLWQPGKTLLHKIYNRLVKAYLFLATQGSPYDKGVFWKKDLLQAARQLIEQEGISYVVVTGAPFSPFHHVLSLKEKYPELKIAVDYRDPWTNSVVYGMQEISPSRLAYEKALETEVLTQVDRIFTPYPPAKMLGPALDRVTDSVPVSRLPHAYDPEDLAAAAVCKASPQAKGKIRLVYGGAIYQGLELTLQRMAQALQEMASYAPTFLESLEWLIYTSDHSASRFFEGVKTSAVEFQTPIPQAQLFAEITQADISLLFLANHNCDFQTTKFFESLSLGTPFLLIGPEGEVSSYVEQHRLGVCISPQALTATSLKQGIEQAISMKAEVQRFDPSPYAYPAVTHDLIQTLEST